MSQDIFSNTAEGDIADGIERWLASNFIVPFNSAGGYTSDAVTALAIYRDMDGETWIRSANAMEAQFAQVCNCDPFLMFKIAFQIAMLRRNLDVSIITDYQIEEIEFKRGEP